MKNVETCLGKHRPLTRRVGTWRATSEEIPSIIHRPNIQTWHATSLHSSGKFLLRRGAPRPYTRPVIFV
ncbi:MAG: hypothetical protein HDS16_03710, partial [Bacteroides sp.]|nr:hypothetical protein [Bacteroides sp.]